MSSSNPSEPLDLDAGLRVTTQDVEALFRARMFDSSSVGSYIRFLAEMPSISQESLRLRPGPCGEPFRLWPD